MLRYIYMGTPHFADIILRNLIESGYPPVGVMTQADKPAGRGRALTPPPVKLTAEKYGLPLLQPKKIGDGTRKWMRDLNPDICLIAAYGKILTRESLELAPMGCINSHGSLLPKYRGSAPIARAIINGDKETGVTIMHVDMGQDTGDVIFREAIPIEPEDDCQTLTTKLAEISGPLFAKAMDALERGDAPRIRQEDMDEEPTLAPRLAKSDGLIDWALPANQIFNLIRGAYPWPGAYTFVNCKTMKVLKANLVPDVTGEPGTVIDIDKEGVTVAAKDGAIKLLMVQMQGKRSMECYECACGLRLKPGQHFGEEE